MIYYHSIKKITKNNARFTMRDPNKKRKTKLFVEQSADDGLVCWHVHPKLLSSSQVNVYFCVLTIYLVHSNSYFNIKPTPVQLNTIC